MSYKKSRLERRSKKKSNMILNLLIGVVILLIVVVGASIFLTDDSTEKASADKPKQEDKKENNSNKDKDKEEVSDLETEEIENQDEDKSSDSDEDEKNNDEKENGEINTTPEDESGIKEQDSTEPNVEKSIINSNWKPIGTKQSGEHTSVYEEGTPDWNEKVKALSYATGIPVDNMTVWYIAGNGSPDKSIGTVTAKGGSQAYRVYLQWIDGQGWKPTKLQELKENDKD
ncbi:cytoskeletal protein RodZ [Bacillus pakistanensis]|uniref:Cytoskeletal protein RodZ n=1 Tax=Rossellomorea pakistanensis TaxID=992288 RepID=A0ABS2NA93_9BACI|nr:YrrS family protein [Bacillus pakistanensis]MBM7584772.1 cytoskeletal protein RodZ [Bacillus pakistanensis]